MNFIATEILNETPFVPKSSVPDKIPQKSLNRPSNPLPKRNNNYKVKATDRKPLKSDNNLFNENIMDPFYFNEYLKDLSFDKSDESCDGYSYLGMLSELLSSSSEEKPKKTQKNSRYIRPKTSQSITNINKNIIKTSSRVEKAEKNKENIPKFSNLLQNKKPEKQKPKEEPKKPISPIKRGRKSGSQSEKSTQTGKAGRLVEIQERQANNDGLSPKKRTLKARSFSEKSIQTIEKSRKNPSHSAEKNYQNQSHNSNSQNKKINQYSQKYESDKEWQNNQKKQTSKSYDKPWQIQQNSQKKREIPTQNKKPQVWQNQQISNQFRQNEKKEAHHKILKTRPFSASPQKVFQNSAPNYDISIRPLSYLGSIDERKPKFNLNLKKPPRNQQDNYYGNFSPTQRKRLLEMELEQKRQQALYIKNQRKKREDYYQKTSDIAHKFVSEAKKRILERKKQEKIDWNQKFYSYSAHKEHKTHELMRKKTKVLELKEQKLKKKESRVQEKKHQKLQKINEYIFDKVFKGQKYAIVKKQQKKTKDDVFKQENTRGDRDRKTNEKENFLNSMKGPQIKPLRFGRPESSPVKLLSVHHEKKKPFKKENFDLKEAMMVFDNRASEYLDLLKEEKNRRQKLKRMRKLKVRKVQETAKLIRENCSKKPFKPKKDFNQSFSDDDEFDLEKEQEKERQEKFEKVDDEPEEVEYKKMSFPDKKKGRKTTKIMGKHQPTQQKLQKAVKNLKKQDLKLYKYSDKSQKFQDIDDEDQKKAILAGKNDRNAKFTKVPPADLNKMFDDAKVKKIPKDLLQHAVPETNNNENIIEKSLRDYREERNQKKSKKGEEKQKFPKEEDEKKLNKLLGFENPIEKFQKELQGEFRNKPVPPKVAFAEEIDDFPEELLG